MVRRRSGLLPFTLTEVLALLFFVLALALVREATQRAEAEERAAENQALQAALGPLGPAGVEALVRALSQGGQSVPEDFDELVRNAQMAGQTRAEAERLAQSYGLPRSFVDTASTSQLLDTASALHTTTEQAMQALEQMLGQSGESGDRGEALDVADRIAQLVDNNRNLRGQLANLQRRAGNGLDHPPCWADERGRPEYAFRVTLRDGTVDVEPIWPPHREDDARRTPGMTAAPGTALALPDFERRAAPIFAWSRRQEPECRHMVHVVDRVPADKKDVFIDELLAVERYFYKYLVR